MSFLKGTAEIAAILAAIALISNINPQIGLAICLAILLLSLFAIIRPLPSIRLPSRLYNLSVAIFVGFLGTAIPGVMLSKEQQRITELRSSDPAAYLAELEATDKTKWLSELQTLDPTRYAETKAKADAEQAEAARKEALRSLEADQALLRRQIAEMDWLEAKSTYARIKQTEADLVGFNDAIESAALEIIKALPSSTTSDMSANQRGYEFLAILRPDNGTYKTKASDYAARIQQARQAAVGKLRRTEDKIEGITFYRHPNAPKYVNSRSTVYLYIGRNGEEGRPWLRMKVQYAASDWLFVKNVYAWHDGIKEDFISGSFNRDNNTTIWEWVDVVPTPRHLAILANLANAKESVLRFEGMQYRKDVTLSAGDKQALREIILAYNVFLDEH